MPLYRTPEERASETVTVRLTRHERRLLDYLAALEKKTLTDFLRGLIAERALALKVTEVPEPPRRKRPGRPKRVSSITADVGEWSPAPSAAPSPPLWESTPPTFRSPSFPVPTPANSGSESSVAIVPGTFHELVARFRETFAHRADGTRRELDETLQFLLHGREGQPIIAFDTPLCTLTAERLQEIRSAVQDSDLRLAKKNLHLTYLRMMLHFGVKEPGIALHINPARLLEPLSIVESQEAWRFFGGPTK